ncbi:hypothetical protein CHCC14600_4655 [Bacillus licheniformis]|nr:hypothetical protein CHCC14600_4655 [Bacillus licheniformis]
MERVFYLVMDKENWISIVLERIDSEEVYNLIEQSFNLTK